MSQEEILRQRSEKAELIRAEGVEPYGRAFPRSPVAEMKEGDSDVRAAGRIMAVRRHGKASFLDIADASGKVQVYIRSDALPAKDHRLYELADIGDIAGVSGDVFRTRTGELTIKAASFTVLAKALLPLPEKWHGLTDVEARFRKRYLDLVMNPDARAVAEKRMRIIRTLREDLAALGFMEVETPMMHPIPGGAEARPFVTHHNTLDMDLYLRIAPELYLKRLLVGGFERVFEINRSFRNEGISPLHNPEFTMLELYEAYADYRRMMRICEGLLTRLAETIAGSRTVVWQGVSIDFSPPWKEVRWIDCFRSAGIADWSDIAEVRRVADGLGIEVPEEDRDDLFEMLDHVFKKTVQPTLVNPTYVVEYPRAVSPLAKECPGDPSMTERFELFVNGLEVANAYSELNDPREQNERFVAEVRAQRPGRAKVVDEDYIEALGYGMPPAGGLGIGIDRIAMLLTDTTSLREVILFPQMRPRR